MLFRRVGSVLRNRSLSLVYQGVVCESWEPFLSLDQAATGGPGEACDLGTVLARHSIFAWLTDYEGPALPHEAIVVSLEVSHDGIRWHVLTRRGLSPGHELWS
jgi:hypothetical protein